MYRDDTTDPLLLSSAQVSFTADGTGAVARTVQDELRDALKAQQFGVVGDGSTDDTAAFILAVTAAIAQKKVLDIRDLKIYLSTQAASITTDGLYLYGSRSIPVEDVAVNWDLMEGSDAQWSVVKAALIAMPGSLIVSRYNGSIFTGKEFYGQDFSVMGDSGKASNSCFTQSTPTAYPGWSKGISNLHRFSGYYFGTDGIKLLGGLEVADFDDINVHFSQGYCLHVKQTTGVNSPIEYLQIKKPCGFTHGLSGNILLDGVKKDIDIDGVLLNESNQLSRRVNAGEVVTIAAHSDIVYPIVIKPAPVAQIIGVLNVRVRNCFGEQIQGIVRFAANDGAFFKNVKVEHNYYIAQDASWSEAHAKFDVQVIDLFTEHNDSPGGVEFHFTSGTSVNSRKLHIQERRSNNGCTISGDNLADDQMSWPHLYAPYSATIGDGTAATFTLDLADTRHVDPGGDVGSMTRVYAAAANFQGTGSDAYGVYLLFVTRMDSGNYIMTTIAGTSTTGFSGAPTLSTAGVLSLPLSAFTRARVTRLDQSPLTPITFA